MSELARAPLQTSLMLAEGTLEDFRALALPARNLRAVALMLIAWITIPAVLMAVIGNAPAALVILPPDWLVDVLPEGVALVSVTRCSVTVREGAEGAADGGPVRRRSALGAPWVLPSGLTGCFAVLARAVG